MVAKSYIKSIARSIKSSFSRFLAIFCIVALGVGFLAGLLSATPDMRNSVDVYYKNTNFMDLQIMGNLGLGQYDIDAIADLPFVEGVMASVSSDLISQTKDGDTLVTRVHSTDFSFFNDDNGGAAANNLNQSMLIEGRWPTSVTECVIEAESALGTHYSIGDTLSFTADNKDLADLLRHFEFTVVGTVYNSYYLNTTQRGYTNVGNGKISTIAYLPEAAFATDYFTEAYVSLKGGDDFDSFGGDYIDFADDAAAKVEDFALNQKHVRRDALFTEAVEKLDDAKKTLAEKTAEAEAELEDARIKLEDGQKDIEKAGQELFDGQIEYEKGLADLAKAKSDYAAEIADAEAQIADGEETLATALLDLEQGQRELDDGLLELEEGRAELEEGRITLNDAIKTFEDAEKKIIDGEKQVKDGLAEISDGKAQLNDAWAQIVAAEDKIVKGEAELDEGQKELDEGKALLELSKAALPALEQAIAAAKENRDLLEELFNNTTPAEAVQEAIDFVENPENAARAAEIGRRIANSEEVSAEDYSFYASFQAASRLVENADELLKQLEEIQKEYESVDDLIAELEVQLAEATRQIEENEQAIIDGQAAIDKGRAELEQGKKELADGKSAYYSGAAQLEEGERDLRQAEKDLKAGRAELEENRPELLQAIADFEEAEALIIDGEAELLEGARTLQEGWDEYYTGLIDLEEAKLELEDGKVTAEREFAKAERTLKDAKTKLEDGSAELLKGKAELEDGWDEYYKGVAEMEDQLLEARDKITEAEDKLADLDDPKWYILTRESNAGYVSYLSDSDKIEAIARVFPLFFFLVATLVASTTMTRMVEEERGNIGTLKALGYSNTAIGAKFYTYAGIAAIFGSLAGLAIGLNMFPSIIYNAYRMMYNLPPLNSSSHFIYGTIGTVAIFIGIMVATAGALNSSLKENAASLMRPKTPKEGKRIFLERVTPIWKRLKFTHKVTARNLFRYKKRFFMTVVGIFGCTALLVCGFGLRDSISGIVNLQFGKIFTYDMVVTVKHSGDHISDPRISRIMNNEEIVSSYAVMHSETSIASTSEGEFELTVICPQTFEEFDQYVNLYHRKSKERVFLNETSVVITEKAALALDVKIGDKVTVENSDEKTADFTVSDIVENYVQGYIYMPKEVYEQGFGSPCKFTTLFANLTAPDREAEDNISVPLLKSPNVLNVNFTGALIETFDEMLKTIDLVVVVLIASAGLLAFVVMYNLTNINIAERQKEIATLKVLGFNAVETAAYIFRETTIIALVGALVGLFGGKLLHGFVVRTAEVDNMMFGRSISWVSMLLSFVITLAFSLIVNLVMTTKLKKISMADSLKAPE